MNMFFLAYLVSPRFCHRFVGYLEEEAVKTYTYCLEVRESKKGFLISRIGSLRMGLVAKYFDWILLT